MTFRPMPVLTALSLVCLVILILLGNWQYERYSEKLARPAVVELAEAALEIEVELERSITGNVQQVYGFANSEPIWRRYAPARVTGTDELILVMVEATGGAKPVPAALSDLPATLRFRGILASKVSSGSAFYAEDNPEAGEWYSLDPDKIAKHLGLSGPLQVAEPLNMIVRNADNLDQSRLTANPYAFSKPVDPLPPERHFGYALTWWGMALGLIGVYLALHRARGRLTF